MKKYSKLVIFNIWLSNKELLFNCLVLILAISVLIVYFDYSILYI
jgi:hypothetical protein